MTQMFVNLPVTDLERAKAFYTAIGFTINPLFTDHNAACVVVEEDHSAIMILTRDYFQTFTDLPLGDPAVSPTGSTSVFLDSREAVDAAAAAGLRFTLPTLSTFPHPHYELIAQMLVHDGDGEVREYYHDTRVAFPDQDHEIIAFRHSVDAVIVEFWLTGTHLGPLGKIPPTGGTHRTRMTAYFIFDENENLVTERIYFDQLTILKQLIGGLDKKKPKDLAKLAGALKGALAMAGTEPDPRLLDTCLLYTSTSPRDRTRARMLSSA